MSKMNLNVGIAGLGTVGVGVVKILQSRSELLEQRTGKKINIVAVSARSQKDRGINLDGIKWYDNASDIADDENVDTVVELIGGDEGIAYDLCLKAIKNGKNFVTANKALIAKRGNEIALLAEENNVYVAFEAAVAGGIPVIKTLKEGLAGNEITKISGILNGTCNYMLTAMKDTGRDFDVILKEAQELGYAEADPSFDVGGIDAAHKLVILTSLAFGVPVDFDNVYIEGIEKISLIDVKYAKELGYRIKLLGLCSKSDNGISQKVCPCLVLKNYPVASVEGVDNAVFIEGDAVGKIVLQGPGAGQGATASAVVADIADIASGRKSYMFNAPVEKLAKSEFVAILEHVGRYYIRVTAEDRSGVLASVSDVLRDELISVDSILQKSAKEGEHAHIIVVTHKTSEKAIIKAVEKIEKQDSVIKKPNVIRIEG
ncbi:MAG: homoserine dehydrogenase [Alphaproteobacteria bacterium CG11_big_fil_rev_8_21_14_0_20_39_49]|nr:MAG: homoserine dehydrogenase [Alphaproteobacteria bacterium CG11_big_fil_rev_8_21_14_0_20_39_49]